MYPKNWAIVKREEVIDSRTFMSKVHIRIVEEFLTRAEADSYMQGESKDFIVMNQQELELLKKQKKASY